MNKKRILDYVKVILPIVLVAVLGSIFVNIGMEWFNSLVKPTQWIPNFVIPIMWSIIYIAFAVVLILWLKDSKIPLLTFILLIINVVLNVLWCLVFFTLEQTFLGNIIIVLNLIAGIWLAIEISKSNKFYALAVLIYPIWLSIATTTFTITVRQSDCSILPVTWPMEAKTIFLSRNTKW